MFRRQSSLTRVMERSKDVTPTCALSPNTELSLAASRTPTPTGVRGPLGESRDTPYTQRIMYTQAPHRATGKRLFLL